MSKDVGESYDDNDSHPWSLSALLKNTAIEHAETTNKKILQ